MWPEKVTSLPAHESSVCLSFMMAKIQRGPQKYMKGLEKEIGTKGLYKQGHHSLRVCVIIFWPHSILTDDVGRWGLTYNLSSHFQNGTWDLSKCWGSQWMLESRQRVLDKSNGPKKGQKKYSIWFPIEAWWWWSHSHFLTRTNIHPHSAVPSCVRGSDVQRPSHHPTHASSAPSWASLVIIIFLSLKYSCSNFNSWPLLISFIHTFCFIERLPKSIVHTLWLMIYTIWLSWTMNISFSLGGGMWKGFLK